MLLQETSQRKKEKQDLNSLLSTAVGKVSANSFVKNTLLTWDKKMQNLDFQ